MSNSNLPKIDQLGADLLETNVWQRWQPVVMPTFWGLICLITLHLNSYWLAGLSLVLVFSATSTSTHDVLHGSLGLSRRMTEWLLFFLAVPILESGLAYRMTHLFHHKVFPGHEDLEGRAAHEPIWKVLLGGPTFLPKLWLWSWNKAARMPIQRRWLIAEALLPFLALVLGWLVWPLTHSVLIYVLMVGIASWFYPVFAVHLPHKHFEDDQITHAWTVRGRILPKLFLPLAYHLEHHLYPMVPSHNLPKLAERLRPYLAEDKVRVIHVP